ncbi:MAG: hypothetical protein A4E73_02990 [Syntrophaceae bacterium PtaU1.Bin231]|nr:MAG: hypothetical protein A4E73_02990 [Syntrophaceae bacterium PtaU1.Bin231]
MFFYHMDRQHWVFFALAAGIGMVLLFVLSYLVMWSTRKLETEQANGAITGPRTFLIWFQATFPWILILTLLGTIVLTIVYSILKWKYPPNW